jgi:hypothetical protein
LLEIFLIAVGSMFWPLLLVVVLLALNTPRPVPILAGFLAGGLLTTISIGAALVFTFDDTTVTSESGHSAGPYVDIAIGLLALLAALVLQRMGKRHARREAERTEPKPPSRSSALVERLVARGAALAFVGGIIANILPGPLPFIGLKKIAQLDYTTGQTMLVITIFYVIMFTFIEAPLVSFLVAPEWTRTTTVRFNAWLGRNLVRLGVWALVVVGVLEIVRGVVAAL